MRIRFSVLLLCAAAAACTAETTAPSAAPSDVRLNEVPGDTTRNDSIPESKGSTIPVVTQPPEGKGSSLGVI